MFNFQRVACSVQRTAKKRCEQLLIGYMRYVIGYMLCVVSFAPTLLRADSEPYDVLIRNGIVYDGLSREGQRLDIGIRGERIAAVGDLSSSNAEKIIDAKERIVAPGFIDIHTHSDFNPFLNPTSSHKIVQGVTTEIVGNCGMSAAPIFGFHEKEIHDVWLREGVVIPNSLPWHHVQEYFQELEKQGLMTNLALLIGHGNLRSSVIGFEPRKATLEEIERMKILLRNSLREGAFGLSLGLVYLPGTFAGEEELLVLAEEARNGDGILAVHMRSEGKTLIGSMHEILDLSRKAKVRLQISHLKAAGVRNWYKINEAFSLLEAARNEGLEVYADAYPYEASFAELGVILPDEIYQAPDRLEMLRGVNRREELKNKISAEFEENGTSLSRVMIAKTNLAKHRFYEGKTIDEIARAEKKDPMDIFLDLLVQENFKVSAFSFSQDPNVVERVIKKEYVAIGSDNIADFGSKPHPRVYGTFPRIVEKFVRKEKVLSLGDAIRKMTSLPANIIGLRERGALIAGYYADVVIFNLEAMKSEASYEKPDQLAQGVEYVLINGKLALEGGKETGLLAGQVLRKGIKGKSTTRT